MKHLSRIFIFVFVLGIIFPLAGPAAAQAQNPEYRLHVRRDFGYGAGSNIRGNFSLSIYGTETNIQSVKYLIDGQEMGTVSQPPFGLQFKTSSYPSGQHQLTAEVTTKDGRTVVTPPIGYNFLSASQESSDMGKIFIPLGGGILLITLIGVGIQFLMMRRGKMQPGAARHYGLKGGTICPRCGRAYPIHFWSINLIGGALDRCDFCGKWAIVHRHSPAELAAAEKAERAALRTGESSLPGINPKEETEAERRKKLLDESRYTE